MSWLPTLLIWMLEGAVVFVASTAIFDILHYLLHRWGKSSLPLLRLFASWHWVHHAFLDRKMRVHTDLTIKNVFYHILPEYLTSMAGTVIFLFVFPWQPIVALVVIRTIMLGFTLKDEGMDANHMARQRISGKQGLLWVGPDYHAMHHIYPDNFYSSFSNLFDLIFGTTCQISGRRFLITGANGAFGSAVKRRIEKLGGIVDTLKSGVDFGPADYGRVEDRLKAADVLILSHGAKTDDCWNANYVTFVELIDRFIAAGKDRLVPPEVWALGSEAEIHGDFGMPSMVDYAASKRAYAKHARSYYQNADVIYRHIVPSAFTSAMGPGPMSADTAARIALFFIRRGFCYVPVTFTTLAFWNYFRFRSLRPGPTVPPASAGDTAPV